MERHARDVLREHARLDRPDTAGLGACDHGLHEGTSDTTAPRAFCDVDGALGDSGVARPRRGRGESDPAHDATIVDGDEPVLGVVAGSERVVVGRLRLERRRPGCDAVPVDRLDRLPVLSRHGSDLDHGLETRLAAWSGGRPSTATGRSSTGTPAFIAELEKLFGVELADGLLVRYHELEPRIQADNPGASYREVLTIALEALADETGLTLPEGEASALARSLPEWPVFEDARPGLAEAHARGWKLAILSNTDRDLVDASMEALGAPFELAIVAGEIGSYKPEHRHWEVFYETTGADRRGHVHVAQSLFHDIEPANELGIPSIWINRLGEPEDPRPTATLKGVGELANALDALVPE